MEYSHNLIRDEHVAYLSHTHTLYKDDNALVFEILEESWEDPQSNQPYNLKNIRKMEGSHVLLAASQ